MAERLEGEIDIDLMHDIIKTLPQLESICDSHHAILIHGMGGKSRGFYHNLTQNKSVELLWTDWSGRSWWSYLFSFIPGQAGLAKVIDRKLIDRLFEIVGGRSMSGLYFVPEIKVESILEEVKKKNLYDNIEKILEQNKDYFLLTVDFDYFPVDKNVSLYYRQVVMGDNLDEEIKKALTRTR